MTWAQDDFQNKFRWIYGDSQDTFVDSDRRLHSTVEETFDNIFQKTQRAIQYFLVNDPPDYFVRTNLSSYFDTQIVIKNIKLINQRNFIYGPLIPYKQNGPIQNFISGASIIFPLATAEIIAKDETNHDYPDDVYISKIAHENAVQFISGPMVNLSIGDELIDEMFYRCKHVFFFANKYRMKSVSKFKKGNRKKPLLFDKVQILLFLIDAFPRSVKIKYLRNRLFQTV